MYQAILPLDAVWRRSFTDTSVPQGKKPILLSRGSVVHYFSLLLRILKFTQHFPFVAGWTWSVSVQTCFPFWSSFARMAHCYGCRVKIIIIIFVQVVLDVVDKWTALTLISSPTWGLAIFWSAKNYSLRNTTLSCDVYFDSVNKYIV